MHDRSRLVLGEATGIVILILGGPGTAIFGQYLGIVAPIVGGLLAAGIWRVLEPVGEDTVDADSAPEARDPA
jgi:hypothetical protein